MGKLEFGGQGPLPMRAQMVYHRNAIGYCSVSLPSTVGAAIGRPKGFGILSFTVKTERVPRPTLRAANGRPYGYKPTNSVYL